MYQVTAITNDEQLKGIPYVFHSLIMYISYLWSDYEDSSWDIQAGIEDIEAFTHGRIFFQIIGLILPVCHKVVTSSHVAIITALFVMYSSDNLLRFQSYSIYVFNKSMRSNHSTLSVYCQLLSALSSGWHIGSCQNRRYSSCVSCVTRQLNNY